VRRSGDYHHLAHGTTLHGAQNSAPPFRTMPLTYYHREGPLGQLFASMFHTLPSRRVAVVGLGTGTVACYGRRGERFTFYEIDPLVERIARDARLFTYLRDCPPQVDVVLGDARLRLADAPAAAYDLIVLDAFSSDAIPVHLLTREALALYLSKLADGGAIALHISNRYLDLLPVVAELARDARVAGVVGRGTRLTAEQTGQMLSSSAWVVLSRRARDLGSLARREGWDVLPPAGDRGLWTDDFSNVLRVITW
jgi:spermidine synthase